MSKNIIKMTHKDVASVLEIIKKTKTIFKEQGIDQWQNGYPNGDTLRADLGLSQGYLIVDEGAIVGYLALVSLPDVNYTVIKGKWQSQLPYISMHRFVIAPEHRGKGYAKSAFKSLEQTVQELGFASIRVDTHADNASMLHLIETNDYVYCGLVEVADGERRAFQKDLV